MDTSEGWPHPLAVGGVAHGGFAPTGIGSCLAISVSSEGSGPAEADPNPDQWGRRAHSLRAGPIRPRLKLAGRTEVGPPSSAAIGLLVALFLANLERGAMGPPAACPQPSLRLVRWARRRDCQHCVPTVAGAWQPSSKEPKKDGSFS
jgi:hypothetical protein